MGVAKSASMSTDQQRIRQLEKQVSHLIEVNEILKKAHVYFHSVSDEITVRSLERQP